MPLLGIAVARLTASAIALLCVCSKPRRSPVRCGSNFCQKAAFAVQLGGESRPQPAALQRAAVCAMP
jgi:hypothetical protein